MKLYLPMAKPRRYRFGRDLVRPEARPSTAPHARGAHSAGGCGSDGVARRSKNNPIHSQLFLAGLTTYQFSMGFSKCTQPGSL